MIPKCLSVHAGILDSPDDFDSSTDVYDAVGGVIQEASGSEESEEVIRELCDQMFAALKG